MLYLIKVLYSFILPPGLFVLLFLVPAFMLWRRERRTALFLLASAVFVYLASTSLVGGALVRGLESRYPQPAAVSGDVIVMLGGGATGDTPDLDGQGNLLGSASGRLLTAARLHKSTGLPIVVSGGQVFADSGNEAEIAKRQLMALGIPGEAVMTENRSLNTQQNAEYTAGVLAEHNLNKPVLVTSAFHMPRAALEFKKAGLNVVPYPTDYRVSANRPLTSASLTPAYGSLEWTGTALKEYLGLIALMLR